MTGSCKPNSLPMEQSTSYFRKSDHKLTYIDKPGISWGSKGITWAARGILKVISLGLKGIIVGAIEISLIFFHIIFKALQNEI